MAKRASLTRFSPPRVLACKVQAELARPVV